MARVFLTGATGYLGGCLRGHLEASGHAVQCLDGRLADLPPDSIDAEVIVHAAAAVRGTTAYDRLAEQAESAVHRVNVDGTRRVLEAAPADARVILVSSKSVYGTAAESAVATETAPPAPEDAYARSKLEAETLVRARHRDFIVLRPATFFGHAHGRHGPPSIVTMIDTLLNHGEVPVFGGDQWVDPLHVHDLAALIERLCRGQCASGITLNVPGEVVSVETMAESMLAAAGRLGIGGRLRRCAAPARVPLVMRSDRLASELPDWAPTPADRVVADLVARRRADRARGVEQARGGEIPRGGAR